MTYLLDTNAFMWAVASPRELSRRARRICESQSVQRVVSVASLWELLTKVSLGRLPMPNATAALTAWVEQLDARVLPIETPHVYALYGLPLLHKDPFDRMLVAQAVSEGLTLVTPDEAIHQYPIKWLW